MKIDYSQISISSLKQFLQEKYQIPIGSEVIFLASGFNDTYKVSSAKENFIFRVYKKNWRTYKNIEAEVALLELLRQHQLPVSHAIPSIDGLPIAELDCPEGTKFGVLFNYAEGLPIESFDLKSAQLFGEQLAKVHLVSKDFAVSGFSTPYRPSDILSYTESCLRSRLKDDISWIDTWNQLKRPLDESLNAKVLEKLDQGICHGDPHHENCHLDTSTVTFFDFDFSGMGYLHYDLGSFFHYEKRNQEIRSSFLKGYRKVLILSDEEIQLIPYFEVLMRIYHLGARTQHADGIQNPLWPNTEIKRTLIDIKEQLAALKD